MAGLLQRHGRAHFRDDAIGPEREIIDRKKEPARPLVGDAPVLLFELPADLFGRAAAVVLLLLALLALLGFLGLLGSRLILARRRLRARRTRGGRGGLGKRQGGEGRG